MMIPGTSLISRKGSSDNSDDWDLQKAARNLEASNLILYISLEWIGGVSMSRDVFAVFSGGGVKGAAFLGAIEEAEKYVHCVGWGGTSAGSIVAAMLACGYSVGELKNRLYAAPYS